MGNFLKLLVVMCIPVMMFGAEEVSKELSILLSIIGPYLSEYAIKYPGLGSVLAIMVTARLIIKPVMSAILVISKDVDISFIKKIAEFSDNKIYKIVAFIMDYVLSIKLPKKK